MAETSTRVLLDRAILRLDGRPFFTFGARLFLTPSHKIVKAIEDIATAGFTTVMTPPASPGNLSTLNTIFNAADKYGLLVIVSTDPRYPEPSGYLGSCFKHRGCLHSYCLRTLDDSEDAFIWFCRERDRLRTQDLFHPIWTPYRPGFPFRLWLDSVDFHSVRHGIGGPFPRQAEENGADILSTIPNECAKARIPGRPLFCHSFQVGVPDRARQVGLYSFDPYVRQVEPIAENWHPYLATLTEWPRWDFLPPDPDLIRIRAFELLAARSRGIMADFYEFLGGPSPMTGRDRFCELACLAQEVSVFQDFFSEGQWVRGDLETGHPVWRARMLHHIDDILIMLWRSAQGDEFWIDPSKISRVEVTIGTETQAEMQAWHMDFPVVKPVPIARDAKGAIRIQLDSLDLTGKILLTRSQQRPQDIARTLQYRLPKATEYKVKGLEHRLAKVELVEQALNVKHVGIRQMPQIEECRKLVTEAHELFEINEYVDAWQFAAHATQMIRTIINRQMVSAMTVAFNIEKDSVYDLLRRSYYTLPQFYYEISARDADIIQEYT